MRRFTGEKGKVEPMPDVLPLNALPLFPWTVILLTALLGAAIARKKSSRTKRVRSSWSSRYPLSGRDHPTGEKVLCQL